jgi:hypothetical protein
VVQLKRGHGEALKGGVPGGQEIAELLTRAHGIATRRKPHACPVPTCAKGCPVCSGRGYTEGEYAGDWRAVVEARAARG